MMFAVGRHRIVLLNELLPLVLRRERNPSVGNDYLFLRHKPELRGRRRADSKTGPPRRITCWEAVQRSLIDFVVYEVGTELAGCRFI